MSNTFLTIGTVLVVCGVIVFIIIRRLNKNKKAIRYIKPEITPRCDKWKCEVCGRENLIQNNHSDLKCKHCGEINRKKMANSASIM